MELTVVVSVYNEEDVIKDFYSTLLHELTKINISCEIILVNDGSTDSSLLLLKELTSEVETIVINFSRNFGHEAAMIAGIDKAKGKKIICLDADLQHPPSLIHKLLEKAKEGNDVVLMKREERKDAGFVKNLLGSWFYAFINFISPVTLEKNVSDFFLISDRVALVLKSDFRERIRFLRGYIQLLGFNKDFVNYVAPNRAAGESKYNIRSLISLSTEAITSFSKIPLRLGISVGLIGIIISIIIAIYSLVMFLLGDTPSGYTTLIITITVLSSIQFLLIGFIGLYVGHLFDEIKKRPIYIIEDVY